MKKLILIIGVMAAITIVISQTVIGVRDYVDRKECVCSILTADEQTFLIDNRLYRVCEKDTLKSGTFMMVRTKCDHGQSLHLTIMPDEGKYRGYVLPE